VNSLPKTVIRQHRDCDLNTGPSAPESSMLTTRLPSHPLHIQCSTQKPTPMKFSNNFNRYWPILINFVQKIYKESPMFTLVVSSFDKTGYQLRLIP